MPHPDPWRDLWANARGSAAATAGTVFFFLVASGGVFLAFFPDLNPIAQRPGAAGGAAVSVKPGSSAPGPSPLGPDRASSPIAVRPAEPAPTAVATPAPPAPIKPPEDAAPEAAGSPHGPSPFGPSRAPPHPPAAAPKRAKPPSVDTATAAPAPRAKSEAATRPEKRSREGSGTGYLTVEATPWAEVSVDAVAVDRTPIASLPLPAGVHTVELVNGELGARVTRKVKIAPGATANLKVNLEQAATEAGEEGN